ncbi:hypothetical protein HMPREF1557_02147 [Streptococcus sobrinus W1703]|uniref:Uncharacterized protein n=1 Tax=Streptococcus sobrinus W1703 TaxID=1227275 RepID=U2IIP2_9STRE|nr:hypothetical protein HMPREF1557_02147 [Streptococcus sobrinus W1703]
MEFSVCDFLHVYIVTLFKIMSSIYCDFLHEIIKIGIKTPATPLK